MVNDFSLLTPDKVVVQVRLASLGSRAMAAIIDIIVVVFLLFLLMRLTTFLGMVSEGLAMGIMTFALTFGFLIYNSLFEGLWNGQTLGKKAASIRVRMVDGTPVTFTAAFFRNLLRPADFLPVLYGVGIITIFMNRKSQRLGDLAAGTLVVTEPKAVPRFAPSPHKFGLHPFEPHVGELRRMTQEEYFAIKRLCDRFPELGPAVQQQMLAEIWEPFAKKHLIDPISNVHPIYLMEAVIMRYGRIHGLL